MAKFFNLGQEQPREKKRSVLSGVGEGLSAGITSGLALRKARSDEQTAAVARKGAEAKILQEEIEGTKSLATNLTVTMHDDPQRVKLFFGTEPGKQAKKQLEKHAGYAFDDQGEFVGLPSKETSEILTANYQVQKEQQMDVYRKRILAGDKSLTQQELFDFALNQEGFTETVAMLMESFETEGSPHLDLSPGNKLKLASQMALQMYTKGGEITDPADIEKPKSEIMAKARAMASGLLRDAGFENTANALSGGLGQQPQGQQDQSGNRSYKVGNQTVGAQLIQ